MNEQEKQRSGYIRYASIVRAIQRLENQNDKLELSLVIDDYAINGTIPTTTNATVLALFDAFEPILTKDRQQWKNGCKPKTKKPNESQMQAKRKPNESQEKKVWYKVADIKEKFGLSEYEWRKLKEVCLEDGSIIGDEIRRYKGCNYEMIQQISQIINKPNTSQV